VVITPSVDEPSRAFVRGAEEKAQGRSLDARARARAVSLASADGHVEAPEVEVLVDGLRVVMARTVGPALLDDYAKVSPALQHGE
jgi:hypothetical protein